LTLRTRAGILHSMSEAEVGLKRKSNFMEELLKRIPVFLPRPGDLVELTSVRRARASSSAGNFCPRARLSGI